MCRARRSRRPGADGTTACGTMTQDPRGGDGEPPPILGEGLSLTELAVVLEALNCIKRAGADGILTYFALRASRWLKE